MIDTSLECEQDLASVDRELREAIARLELVSHASTMNFGQEPRRSSDEPGGKRPSGGNFEPMPRDEDERKAWLESYHRKTPQYFRSRRQKVFDALGIGAPEWESAPDAFEVACAHAVHGLEILRDECRSVRDAWRKQPPMIGVVEKIERKSFLWKCKVADDDSGTIKQREDRYDIDGATIYRYRAQYRGLQRKRAA